MAGNVNVSGNSKLDSVRIAEDFDIAGDVNIAENPNLDRVNFANVRSWPLDKVII